MAKMSHLLLAAFPAEKQKGPKVKKAKSTTQTGEMPSGATEQQHGELASADEPERISTNKPRQMSHSSKAILSPNYDSPRAAIMNNGKSKSKPAMESPKDRVVRDAHLAKVSATRDWLHGNIDSKKHDAIHKRANTILKGA